MRRTLLFLLLLLPAPAVAQAPPAIDVGPAAAGRLLRGAGGEPKTDRVTLKPGQLQRFTFSIAEPFTLELFAVSTDGKVAPRLIEDGAKKWCLYHAETDAQNVPIVPEVVCFQVITKDQTSYRCFLTVKKPTPVPPGPAPPAPKPDWKYLPALERAWGKDAAAGNRPAELLALAEVYAASLNDPSVGSTDKFYSWLNLAYSGLGENSARYVRNALADALVLELGTQDGKLWGDPERKRFEAVVGEITAALRYLAGTAPAPPTPPGPTPTPTPPGPAVGTNLRAILVAESNAMYPKEQVYTLSSTRLAAWLNAKCPRDGDRAGWRYYDPNQDTAHETPTFRQLWADALPKLSGVKLPAVVIKTDGAFAVVPLPATEAETQALFEKYAGK